MRNKFRTILLALPLLASCSDLQQPGRGPAGETLRVTVGSGPRIAIEADAATRTSLGDDGVSVAWTTGDRIALWALDDASQVALDGAVLTLYRYNASYDSAQFTGDVPAVMERDTYTYYAVSPVPAEVAGMKASFDIPAVQNGAFDGACDVMVAEPVVGPALVEGDNSETVNFRFRHMIHVLKIRIPSNRLGEAVSEMTLVFPEPVAGRMTVDIADPTAAPTIADGSRTLTLRFDQPKTEGDTVYAVIAPLDLTADRKIAVKAVGATRESRTLEFAGKAFTAGHTTPIAYHIPAVGPTTVRFTLADTGEESLGERIGSFTLTAPEGFDLDGNGSNECTFPVAEAGNYDLTFETFPESLQGATLAVRYESENALLDGSLTVPQLKPGGTTTAATLRVPALLEEDFSRCDAFKGPQKTGDQLGTELSAAGLPGWYAGARCEGIAATCANLRSYSDLGGPYHSRLDSRPLAGIKPGKTVSVKLVFRADWVKNKSASMGLIVGRTSDHYLNSAIDDATNLPMTDNGAATPDNIPTEHTVTIANLTAAQSIAWKTDGRNGTMFNYEDLYIDRIRVSIAND